MNKITEEGKSIRQIVPADFVFLSQADQQIWSAIDWVMRKLCGFDPVSRKAIIVVGGLKVNWDNNSGAGTCTIGTGFVSYKGVLWELEEAVTIPYEGGQDDIASRLTGTFRGYNMCFEEKIVQPSPVYGADNTEQVSPHKKQVCKILKAADTPAGADCDRLDAVKAFIPVSESLTADLVMNTAG